jgi:hypothetical protein
MLSIAKITQHRNFMNGIWIRNLSGIKLTVITVVIGNEPALLLLYSPNFSQ